MKILVLSAGCIILGWNLVKKSCKTKNDRRLEDEDLTSLYERGMIYGMGMTFLGLGISYLYRHKNNL